MLIEQASRNRMVGPSGCDLLLTPLMKSMNESLLSIITFSNKVVPISEIFCIYKVQVSPSWWRSIEKLRSAVAIVSIARVGRNIFTKIQHERLDKSVTNNKFNRFMSQSFKKFLFAGHAKFCVTLDSTELVKQSQHCHFKINCSFNINRKENISCM